MMYIELIFIDNFTVDFIILYASVRSSAVKAGPVFLAAAALTGGAYAVLSTIFDILGFIAVRLMVSVLMCCIASRFSGLRAAADLLLRFWALSFLTAGAALGAYHALGPGRSGRFTLVLRLMLIGGTAAATVYELLARAAYIPKNICSVEAVFGSASVVFPAMPDPCAVITDGGGGGVIIVDRSVFLSCPSIYLCKKRRKTRKFRINTAAGIKTLTGIMPDKLYITDNGTLYSAKAYIVIADGIEIDGCRALLGRGIKTTAVKESVACKKISKTC